MLTVFILPRGIDFGEDELSSRMLEESFRRNINLELILVSG